MSDLWASRREEAKRSVEPLAVRMRPRTLDEVAGQTHILGEGKLLRRILAADALTSLIFHGPPGTGKTTLAEVIARHTRAHFVQEHAASVGVKRIREIIDEATRRLELAPPAPSALRESASESSSPSPREGEGRVRGEKGSSSSSSSAPSSLQASKPSSSSRTILFLDEIHRFTRAQQDVLLDDVERGRIILIGATTENPLFAVNSALVSRSTLFRFEPLSEEDVAQVVRRAIADTDRGYGSLNLTVTDDAIAHWARISDGDARRALTALEVAVKSTAAPSPLEGEGRGRGQNSSSSSSFSSPSSLRPSVASSLPLLTIDLATAQESIQAKALAYDPTGDEHYDVISAMIKSVRGSDPDAAVYWIARMLESGEDPRFIARRLAILASEDIGNADPRAIMVADACWSLLERLGMPEGRIPLAQTAIYLALAPKSNASYIAIDEAIADVKQGRTVAVPIMLRDAHKPKSEGSAIEGKGYEYSHSHEVNTSLGGVTSQDYLGVEKEYYRPMGLGVEKMLKERLEEVRSARRGLNADMSEEDNRRR